MPLEPYEARVRFPRVAPRVGPTLNRELGGPIAKAGWVDGFCVALPVARPTLFIVTCLMECDFHRVTMKIEGGDVSGSLPFRHLK